MNRSARFISIPFLFTIFFLLFATFDFWRKQASLISFAQTPTPSSSVNLANAFGTGDVDHDVRADDLTVSGSVSANPTKTNLAQTASAGQKAIFIGAASGFTQKDEVAIIQMSGTNAGLWETAYVADTRPKGRLLLHRTLTNTYTVDASSKAQVVKVPHYRNVRVQSGGTLTVDPWNGSSGGVMFLRVQNDLDVRNGGKVDVSGAGFRGGSPGFYSACGGSYCGPGTSCWPSPCGENSTCYECRADNPGSASRASEGPSGEGARPGGRGAKGFDGGNKRRNTTCCNYGAHDGGGGGGAGGGGGGGSLVGGGQSGEIGGSGSYGGITKDTCYTPSWISPTSKTDGNGDTYLEVRWTVDRCNRQQECSKYSPKSGVYSWFDDNSCQNGDNDAYDGPPGRGGGGGAAGATNSLPSFGPSTILLGIGGGGGGWGNMGGSGGSQEGAGTPGAGSNGGAGGGAIVIFASNISVNGHMLSTGSNGQTATGGGGQGGNGYIACLGDDCATGGGGGGGGGAGGGGGSGGVIRLYGNDIRLGTNQAIVTGGPGGSGAGGGGGGSGKSSDGGTSGGGGSGGSGTRGGNGSVGAIFVTYANSLSGTTNPPANSQIASAIPFSGIMPTPTPTPTPSPKRVFLTSTTYSAGLGGLDGADAKCQARADAKGLGGTWKAWVSGEFVNAASRLIHSTRAYKLLNGTTIANNWTDLTDGSLASAINLDENQSTASCSSNSNVWTNTDPAGNRSPGYTCSSFISSAGTRSSYATSGLCSSTTSSWTANVARVCNQQSRLYCFEQ